MTDEQRPPRPERHEDVALLTITDAGRKEPRGLGEQRPPVRAMYERLAADHQAEAPVPDRGGGVPGDRYPLGEQRPLPEAAPLTIERISALIEYDRNGDIDYEDTGENLQALLSDARREGAEQERNAHVQGDLEEMARVIGADWQERARREGAEQALDVERIRQALVAWSAAPEPGAHRMEAEHVRAALLSEPVPPPGEAK